MEDALRPAGGLVFDIDVMTAVVWRKDDYLTKEAKTFINFCRRTFEGSA